MTYTLTPLHPGKIAYEFLITCKGFPLDQGAEALRLSNAFLEELFKDKHNTTSGLAIQLLNLLDETGPAM